MLVLAVIVSLFSLTLGDPASRSRDMSTLLEELVQNYDANLRPQFGGGPVTVDVTMHIDSIGPISEVDMNFRLDISFRQVWRDSRLQYEDRYNDNFTLSHSFLKKIWTPDTYFPDSLSADKHDVMTPNVLIRLHPNGEILYSARITVIAKCPMKLHYFPMDMQVCKLLVECYGYTTKDLILQWGPEHAVEVSQSLQIAQFTLIDTLVDNYTLQFSTGNFSDLEVNFLFKRDLMYFILQSYVPSTLIVMLSWVSFWVNRSSIPARASLSITTVLTMITLIGTTNSTLPKVSEVKALDIYFGLCFIYVFGALVEFASTCYLTTKEERKRQIECERLGITYEYCAYKERLPAFTIEIVTQVETSFLRCTPNHLRDAHLDNNNCVDVQVIGDHEGWRLLGMMRPMTAARLEYISRIGFPSSFLLLEVAYWTFYLSINENPVSGIHA